MPFRKDDPRNTEASRNVDNSAKTLLANIRFMSVDKPIRAIAVTSAIPNEGKTFVAANLGRAMASSGRRTLIIECDMRRRSMAHELNVHAQHGIYSVLSGEVALEDAAVPTGTTRLHFLDAEPHIPNPSDLLNTNRFAQLVAQVKEKFDYVIFDTPPVGTFVDAAVLGRQVDALFVVVRERFTHRDEIQRAADQLRTANVPLTGIIMNFCERQSSEYYYEYYYKEGYSGRERRRRRANSDLQNSHSMPVLQSGDIAPNSATPAGASRQQAAARPASWSNAPDLGDTGEFIEAAQMSATRGNAGDQSSVDARIPSIGETSVLPAEEIAAGNQRRIATEGTANARRVSRR